MYIFGYGSLVNINSAQKSFKRVLKKEDFIPIEAIGFKKVWNSIESIAFDNQEVNGIFLNLEKSENENTNGVILKIDEEEFSFLKKREKNYSCIEIKEISGFKTDEKIYTFMTTNNEKLATKWCKNCYIPKKYIELLENGLGNYPLEFQNRFKDSYSNYPFEIKDGTYKFVDPIQNKFAKDGIN